MVAFWCKLGADDNKLSSIFYKLMFSLNNAEVIQMAEI